MKYTTGPGMTANPLFLLGVMSALMGVQFLSLGLMGEVMARIYFESQGKPPYVVQERWNITPVGTGPVLRYRGPVDHQRPQSDAG
jgi:hypothetical protein